MKTGSTIILVVSLMLAASFFLPTALAEAPGAWSLSANALPVASTGSCGVYSGYIYCVNGASTYTAPVSGSAVGPWTTSTPYPFSAGACAVSAGYIYCVGGFNYPNYQALVYGATVSGGSIGTWSVSAASYPTSIDEEVCNISAGYIYCLGGLEAQGILSPFTYSAPVSGTSVGVWTSQPSDPAGPLDQACGISGGYIYCPGGFNTIVSENSVYYAAVSSGTVGAWSLSANDLPTAESSQACTVASGYMYCVGGTTTNGATLIPSVIYAPLSGTTVGPWTTSPNNYPIPVEGLSCVNTGGYIYCMGGLTTGFVDTANVYYSQIGSGTTTTTTTTSSTTTSTITSTTTTSSSTTSSPPPLALVCPSTSGGSLMPAGATFTYYGLTFTAPSGNDGGGGYWSSYFFAGPQSSIPPPMLQGWGGVYGTYNGVQGWIVTFFC